MSTIEIKPWLTAINRKNISLPLKKLLSLNKLDKLDNILDYGCGHGFDLNYLKNESFKVTGYDKYIKTYSNESYKNDFYDKILCFYVLNTIPEINERILVIKTLLSILKPNGSIFIAVRSIDELNAMKNKEYNTYSDGLVTSKKTFQKYFSKEDISTLLETIENIDFTYIKFDKKTLFIEIKKKGFDYN